MATPVKPGRCPRLRSPYRRSCSKAFMGSAAARAAVVRTERAARGVVPPPPGREVGLAARVHRIDDAVLLLVRLAADEEQHLVLSVVEEGVADAGAGGERGEVARLHPVQLAVDPGVDLAGDDVGELLLARLGVRPGGAGAGKEPDQVEPDLAQAGGAPDGPGGRHRLVAVRVAVPRLGNLGCGDDEGRSARHGPVSFAPPEPSDGIPKCPDRAACRAPDPRGNDRLRAAASQDRPGLRELVWRTRSTEVARIFLWHG